jgi:hypothetical protein
MDLLKSIISEGGVKDAAAELIYQASEMVPKTSDHDEYLMKVVAKVLELDKNKLFKSDVAVIEDMVKAHLELTEETGDEKFDSMMKKIVDTTPKSTAVSRQAINDLLSDIDHEARIGSPRGYARECRYKGVEFDEHAKKLWWITQESNEQQSQEFAQQLADRFTEEGFTGWAFHVVLRDEYDGNDTSPWKTASN